MQNIFANTEWIIYVDLLGNFASLQKSVEICDGQTEDLGTGGLLLAHLQHPGGDLAPHPRPQLCLEPRECCLGGRRLVWGQTVAQFPLEQHPKHSLIAEDVGVTAASERGQTRAASSLHSHNVCPLHPQVLTLMKCPLESRHDGQMLAPRRSQHNWEEAVAAARPGTARGAARPVSVFYWSSSSFEFIEFMARFNARNINENMILLSNLRSANINWRVRVIKYILSPCSHRAKTSKSPQTSSRAYFDPQKWRNKN